MFSLHIRDHLHPAVETLLERLGSRRGEIIDEMLGALRREVAAHAAAGSEELARMRAHCAAHVDAFLATARTGQVPRGRTVEFVRSAGERGARDGVELETLLRGYRTNATTLTHWIGEQAVATTPEGLRAALAVTRMVMEYTDSVSAALADAFVHESRRLLAESGSAQRDLLEDLLAGRSVASIEPRAQLAGLEPGIALQVAVATAHDLGRAVESVGHQLRMARIGGLCVVRHDELVVVAPAEASLRQLLGRAAVREPLTAGISLPVRTLPEIPGGHREARRALALAAIDGILRLADLTLFDYLLASADDTAHRLGPPGVERLEAPLRETVLAYAESDLNVGATARRLHLHPNTVHYRLRRVERLTGRDLRRFTDMVDLWRRCACGQLPPHERVGSAHGAWLATPGTGSTTCVGYDCDHASREPPQPDDGPLDGARRLALTGRPHDGPAVAGPLGAVPRQRARRYRCRAAERMSRRRSRTSTPRPTSASRWSWCRPMRSPATGAGAGTRSAC